RQRPRRPLTAGQRAGEHADRTRRAVRAGGRPGSRRGGRSVTGTSTAIDREANMRRTSIPVARFRAHDGSHHAVVVMPVKAGWQIVDENGHGPDVVDTLTHPDDGIEQAQAVARDYA